MAVAHGLSAVVDTIGRTPGHTSNVLSSGAGKAEKLQVQGFHYPFPGLGNVVKDGDGYRIVPAPWNPAI
jgi:hypothetical protein